MSTLTSTPVEDMDPAYVAESNLPMILATCSTIHLLALILLGLRLYARIGIVKSFGKDDSMVVAATLCGLGGGFITLVLSIPYGLGQHMDTVPKQDLTMYNQMIFVQAIVSASLALGFLKISIGFSLLRLSSNKWYSRILWALIAFVVAYTIIAVCSWLFYCQPMSGFWDKSSNPKCYSPGLFIGFALFNTACNIFTDVAFAILPIPIIWALQLKLRTRLYLVIVLSLGYVAVAMGGVKAYYQLNQPKDKTFYHAIQFWGFLQLNFGIIAACTPTLRPIVGQMLRLDSYIQYYGGGAGSSHKRRTYGYNNGSRGGAAGPSARASIAPGASSSKASQHRQSRMSRLSTSRLASTLTSGNRDNRHYIKTEDSVSGDGNDSFELKDRHHPHGGSHAGVREVDEREIGHFRGTDEEDLIKAPQPTITVERGGSVATFVQASNTRGEGVASGCRSPRGGIEDSGITLTTKVMPQTKYHAI